MPASNNPPLSSDYAEKYESRFSINSHSNFSRGKWFRSKRYFFSFFINDGDIQERRFT